MVIAAAGLMAVPPEAPPMTLVLTVLFELALTLSAEPAPVIPAEGATSAVEVVSTMLTATEAPIPTLLPEPSTLELAVAVSEVVSEDVRVSGVLLLSVMVAVPAISALAFVTSTLIASAPATPTLLPPAPDVAWAPNSAVVRSASTVRPVALKVVAPVSSARLATLAVLIAAAAPMPVAPLEVLEPLATVDRPPVGPERSATLVTSAAPVEVIVPPVPMSTVVPPVTLLTATAAAIFIAPSLVCALLLDNCCFDCVSFGVPESLAPP